MSDDLAARILSALDQILARLPPSAPMGDRSLTRRQAADYLGIHAKTLATLTASGKVTGYRNGPHARWKYRITELDRYRDDRTTTARITTTRTPGIDWGA